MSDLIDRQAAIDAIMGEPPEPHYPSWYAAQIEKLPSAVDEEWGSGDEECEINLVHACHEIIRKVKGALWI